MNKEKEELISKRIAAEEVVKEAKNTKIVALVCAIGSFIVIGSAIFNMVVASMMFAACFFVGAYYLSVSNKKIVTLSEKYNL